MDHERSRPFKGWNEDHHDNADCDGEQDNALRSVHRAILEAANGPAPSRGNRTRYCSTHFLWAGPRIGRSSCATSLPLHGLVNGLRRPTVPVPARVVYDGMIAQLAMR